jgi:hypothetical protein
MMNRIRLIRNMLWCLYAGAVMSAILAVFCKSQSVPASPMFGTGLGKQNFLVPVAHTPFVLHDSRVR